MPNYRVNKAGVSHAKQLIKDGSVDRDTAWSKAAPDAGEENEVIEGDGYATWSKWHLAEDLDASEGTKGRFRFPYGDFEKVNRAAVIHAKQRASQNGHDDILEAADEVLEALDSATG
jgi:hypothetical protein